MSLENDGENQNKVDQQNDSAADPEGKKSKPLSKAERQKSLRLRDLENGIIQLNLRVPKDAANFLKWFAEQLRKGKNFKTLVMECAQRWSPSPKPDQVPKPKRSPEDVKRGQRILFLGQRAYKLRGWRKVAMKIALGLRLESRVD